MGISDKEAFRILGLPLGVDKDAINERYKNLSCKLSASKVAADKKRLEEVVAAFSQLLPQPAHRNTHGRHKSNTAKSNNTFHHNDEDSDDASSEEDWRLLCRNGRGLGQQQQQQQQLSEAEREKRKAEKRRAKKKRRKEKKKLEKIENRIFNQNADDNKKGDDSGSEEEDDEDDEDEDEEEEGQGLDPSSAFVAMSVKSIKGSLSGRQDKQAGKGSKQDDKGKQEEINGVAGTVLQARQLAMRGNEAANVGQYSAAVRLFTDAIKLHPHDHRFFGNRSYCHHQLSHHDKALKDAEKAIKLAPQWPKGHFRRGTSLRGLGHCLDSETAFEEVLRLDPGCHEAREEIKRVRVTRIEEMGFTGHQAVSAIAKYTHVQPALDALLSGEFRDGLGDVFYSDDEDGLGGFEEEDGGIKRARLAAQQLPAASSSLKMNPRNPEGLTSLWVGNVLPEVTEKMLTQLFAKQGHVTSVRLLKEKYCAFVNYQDKGAAGRAMERLQGHELCGQRLLIKFPDNPIATGTTLHNPAAPRKTKPMQNGTKNTSVSKSNGSAITSLVATSNNTVAAPPSSTVIPSAKPSTGQQQQQQQQQQLQANGSKLKGPVNGDECYFWRTTGCAFRDACKHKHLPRNKGVDRKPWQK